MSMPKLSLPQKNARAASAKQADLFDGIAATGVPKKMPGRQALEVGRNRLLVTAVALAMAFVAVGWRVVDLTMMTDRREPRFAAPATDIQPHYGRADIVDRNGVILATSLPTVSLYADPKDVLDAEETADKLVRVLPDLAREPLLKKLKARGRFVYLKRNLTPNEHHAVHRLGLPGVRFERSERRVYPHGRLLAHVLGATDVDGRGTAGIERRFDTRLTSRTDPLALALDLRLQALAHEVMEETVARFRALGGAVVIMDSNTSEIVAMVSLPDFDPNQPRGLLGEAGFNRATKGVYEMGSTFKLLTAAMALDAGVVKLSGGYDASRPMKVSRFTISDYHAKNRWLSVPEILIYSSNIGAAKMALDLGPKAQQAYLGRLGLLRPSPVELPEVGHPLYPSRWREISTVTVSYGHGISVTPIQLTNAIATLVNGGVHRPATLIKQASAGQPGGLRDGQGSLAPAGERVFSGKTSAQMRGLMRLVVSRGTGRKADVEGYLVGGKTGTAEKPKAGRYDKKANIASFVGAFPIHDPKYVIAVMVDEPKGTKETFGYATGGWVAAPAVGQIVRRLAGVVGIQPEAGMPKLAAEEALKKAEAERERQAAPRARISAAVHRPVPEPVKRPASGPLDTNAGISGGGPEVTPEQWRAAE